MNVHEYMEMVKQILQGQKQDGEELSKVTTKTCEFIGDPCSEMVKAIKELINKYLSKKDSLFKAQVKFLFENISAIGLHNDSLDKAKEYIRKALLNLNRQKTAGDIDEIIAKKNLFKTSLVFLGDLELIKKSLKSKNVEVGYITILGMFVEFINSEYNRESKEGSEAIAEGLCKVINGLMGNNVSKEKVIRIAKEIMSSKLVDQNLFLTINCKCFEKLKIAYSKEEVMRQIEAIDEKMKLEDFEENLGDPQNIILGDVRYLNGHEFEVYLEKLFSLINYTVFRTSLTGDQGADLIISKDGMKTVVQAKKYEGSISNKAIQEVVAAKNYYMADRAMVVTNSSFTKGAIDLALANNVDLWDGKKLEKIVNDLNKSCKKGNVQSAIDYEAKELSFFRDNKFEDAIFNYNKAIELFPNFVEVLFNRGLAYSGKGEADKAINDFNKAIEVGSGYSEICDIYAGRGGAFADKGEYDKAIADFSKVIEINNDYSEAHQIYAKRGEIYARLGKLDEAIEDCNKALKMKPNYTEVYLNRAVIYFDKKEYEKSWQDVHRAEDLGLSINPKFIEELKKASGRIG